jgi:hypothetical protein
VFWISRDAATGAVTRFSRNDKRRSLQFCLYCRPNAALPELGEAACLQSGSILARSDK